MLDGYVEGHTVFEVLAGGHATAVTVRLSWWASDPFAVEMRFRTARRDVSWLVARDLLCDGLDMPVGLGDVQIQPHPHDVDQVIIALSVGAQRSLFRTDAWPICEFLTQTYRQLPAGCEPEALDLDGELAGLLERDRG